MMSADDEDVGWDVDDEDVADEDVGWDVEDEDVADDEDVGWDVEDEDEVQVLLLNSWTEERSKLEAVGEQFIVCSTESSRDESHFGSTELRTISVPLLLILSTTESFFPSIISFFFMR